MTGARKSRMVDVKGFYYPEKEYLFMKLLAEEEEKGLSLYEIKKKFKELAEELLAKIKQKKPSDPRSMRIPIDPDTHSNPIRTPDAINPDTSERSDAGLFSIL